MNNRKIENAFDSSHLVVTIKNMVNCCISSTSQTFSWILIGAQFRGCPLMCF